MEHRKSKFVPVDDNSKVVPARGSERGREQFSEIVVSDLDVMCVGHGDGSRWIGERRS